MATVSTELLVFPHRNVELFLRDGRIKTNDRYLLQCNYRFFGSCNSIAPLKVNFATSKIKITQTYRHRGLIVVAINLSVHLQRSESDHDISNKHHYSTESSRFQ